MLALVVEGRGLPFDPFDDQAQPRVPEPEFSTSREPAPQLHLPADRSEDNRRYLFWSTDGFPKIVNGTASTNPYSYLDLIDEMYAFPSAATVERLRALGVRSVILHTDRDSGTLQVGAARAPVAGLPLVRRELPGRIVFELRPWPQDS